MRKGFTLITPRFARSVNVKSCGFTLIELLVAISILAILATIGLRTFRSSTENAQDQQRLQDMNAYKQSLELYRHDNRSYPKTLNLVAPKYIENINLDPASRPYRYLALPDPSCTTDARSCSGFVICAKKEGDKSFNRPAECASVACNGVVGDCDMGVKGE